MTANILRAAIVTTSAAALIAGGVASASIPAGDGTITACVKGRSVYFIDTDSGQHCRKGRATVQWNARGPAGPAGPQGPKGDTGATGPAGPPGPGATSKAFEALDDNAVFIPVGDTGVDILSKTLPAGKYVLSASISLTAEANGGVSIATCRIVGDGVSFGGFGGVSMQPALTQSLSLDATLNSAGGTIKVHCNTYQNGASAQFRDLTAITVDSLG